MANTWSYEKVAIMDADDPFPLATVPGARFDSSSVDAPSELSQYLNVTLRSSYLQSLENLAPSLIA